jgi:hypothetical protein
MLPCRSWLEQAAINLSKKAHRGTATFIPWLLVFGLSAAPSLADLLPNGADHREIALSDADGRPMIAARIGNTEGRLMFDTGTPDALFLNRDALPIGEGEPVAVGQAASGQVIEVRSHPAPAIEIGGVAFATGPKLRSGDFGFAEIGLGSDFLGFIGTPAVVTGAFLLDHGRKVLTVLRVNEDGSLAANSPALSDVVAVVPFTLIEVLPTTEVQINGSSVVLEFDTGDSGTFYAKEETLARLREAGLLRETEGVATLVEASFGGNIFRDLQVRIVIAGGDEDTRSDTGGDTLRLGADFLVQWPTLWNYRAGTITFLTPGAYTPGSP